MKTLMHSAIRCSGPAKLLLAAALALPCFAMAQQPKLKVGLMMPYSGAYGTIGTIASNGFKQYVTESGGKIGGREIELYTVDDEADPAKATENVNKLIKRDKVDVLVGTIHSGVALAMAKVARDTNTLLLVPNAGADELTGPLCAPNIFRTSFSNWQPGFALGAYVAKRHKTAMTLTWKYAAGLQMVDSFKEAYEKAGGKITKAMTLPFPNTEFQPYLAEIAARKPEAVYVFFGGPGAAKFVREFVGAGLNKTIPLYAPGFLTDGTLESMGNAGQGVLTALHYADGLPNAKDKAFRENFVRLYKTQPDVYAMQAYDAAQLLAVGLTAVKGDFGKRTEMIKAMENATIDSPRGKFTMSKAHNPVQDIYLRKVEGQNNNYVEVLVKGLADPAHGCKM